MAGPSVLSGRVTHKALFLHLTHRLDNLQNELIVRELPYQSPLATVCEEEDEEPNTEDEVFGRPDLWSYSHSDQLLAGGKLYIY